MSSAAENYFVMVEFEFHYAAFLESQAGCRMNDECGRSAKLKPSGHESISS